MTVDVVNRDPNAINGHLQCQFEDTIAEPEGTHSIECVWKASYFCFTFFKGCCYKMMTLFCGICIAAQWGCEFAYISFLHIWHFTPLFRMFDLNCGCLKKLWGQCVACALDPCCESCGLLFHAFRK